MGGVLIGRRIEKCAAGFCLIRAQLRWYRLYGYGDLLGGAGSGAVAASGGCGRDAPGNGGRPPLSEIGDEHEIDAVVVYLREVDGPFVAGNRRALADRAIRSRQCLNRAGH